MLSKEQRIYLIQCYGKGNKAIRRVIEEFNQKFPDIYVSNETARKLIKKFLSTGSVMDVKKTKIVRDEDDAATLLVMDSVRNYPKLSLRRRSLDLGISKSLIQKILKQRKFHPYKPTFNHALEPGDPARRLHFCLSMGAEIMDNQYFYRNIIFSDEATFSTNGTVASQHVRYWSDYNPNFRIPANRQYSAKVNVWCAISYHGIFGPYFFNNTVNQHTYLDMLQHFLVDKLDDLPINYRARCYFQQDGCPAHYARAVVEWLNQEFGQNWIGRNGPVLWPPRSPDLTIADFYLWGRLKQIVYSKNLPPNVENLKEMIRDAVSSLTLNEIRRSYKELRRRLEVCAQRGGDWVE